MKKLDVTDNVNISKVIELLTSKDKELAEYRQSEKAFQSRIAKLQGLAERDKLQMNIKYNAELQVKHIAL